MKKILAGLVFVIIGCGSSTPESVAKDFASALNDKNWDKVRSLTTEESQKIVEMMEGMAGMPEGKQGDVTISTPKFAELEFESCTVAESSAECAFKKVGKDSKQSYNLKLVDGDWKVDIKK